MKYINSNKLDEILKKNENINKYYDDLDIKFTYEISDGTNKATQKSTQKAYGVNIDSIDYVILIDNYSDSSSPYILIEKSSPLLEILNSEKSLYSLIKEDAKINKIIKEYLKPLNKPFGKYEDINESFINKIDDEKEKYLKSFSNSLVEKLNILEDAKGRTFFDRHVDLKEKHLNEMSALFSRHVKDIYNLYKEDYSQRLEFDNRNTLNLLLKERNEKLEKAAELLKIKENEESLINNTKLIELFNYYPVIDVNTKKSELTFSAFNSNNEEIYKTILPLERVEIEYFDKNTGIDEAFEYFILDKDFMNNIQKSDQKKYYHALFELNEVFIYSKFDQNELDYVLNNIYSEFSFKEDSLIMDKPFEFSKIMVSNSLIKDRVSYINEEMKSKFQEKKLKIK